MIHINISIYFFSIHPIPCRPFIGIFLPYELEQIDLQIPNQG